MALGPLIPPRARSFKATRVSRWLCCQEAPPVAGIVLYLRNKGIYREHPFAAACYYSVQLQQSCRYVTGATFLTSQGRTVTFQLKQILRPCLGFQRRKTELLENGRFFSWKLEAEMKNKWSEKWKWKKPPHLLSFFLLSFQTVKGLWYVVLKDRVMWENVSFRKNTFHWKKYKVLVSVNEEYTLLFCNCIRPVCLRHWKSLELVSVRVLQGRHCPFIFCIFAMPLVSEGFVLIW